MTHSPDEEIFFGFNAFKFGHARRRFSRRLGLRLCDLLLNVFEVLKRLKFHALMLPQARQINGSTYKTPCSAMEKA